MFFVQCSKCMHTHMLLHAAQHTLLYIPDGIVELKPCTTVGPSAASILSLDACIHTKAMSPSCRQAVTGMPQQHLSMKQRAPSALHQMLLQHRAHPLSAEDSKRSMQCRLFSCASDSEGLLHKKNSGQMQQFGKRLLNRVVQSGGVQPCSPRLGTLTASDLRSAAAGRVLYLRS